MHTSRIAQIEHNTAHNAKTRPIAWVLACSKVLIQMLTVMPFHHIRRVANPKRLLRLAPTPHHLIAPTPPHVPKRTLDTAQIRRLGYLLEMFGQSPRRALITLNCKLIFIVRKMLLQFYSQFIKQWYKPSCMIDMPFRFRRMNQKTILLPIDVLPTQLL